MDIMDNERIPGWFGVEGTLKTILFQFLSWEGTTPTGSAPYNLDLSSQEDEAVDLNFIQGKSELLPPGAEQIHVLERDT